MILKQATKYLGEPAVSPAQLLDHVRASTRTPIGSRLGMDGETSVPSQLSISISVPVAAASTTIGRVMVRMPF